MPTITLNTEARNIVYEELARGYREHFSDDAQMGTRILAVDWDQSLKFKEDMLGWSQELGGHLSRTIPERHPEIPHLWCAEVQLMEEEGQHSQQPITGIVKYEKAVYACTYRALPYRIKKDDEIDGSELNRYVIRSDKIAFEQQKIPGNDFKFVAPGKAWDNQFLGEVPALPIAFTHLEYTVKAIPPGLIPELLIPANTVNSATFDDSTLPGETRLGGYAAGTVLYTGVNKRFYWTSYGHYVCDMIYTFAVRSPDWNYFSAPDGRLYQVVRASDGVPGVFGTSDLNNLFVFNSL